MTLDEELTALFVASFGAANVMWNSTPEGFNTVNAAPFLIMQMMLAPDDQYVDGSLFEQLEYVVQFNVSGTRYSDVKLQSEAVRDALIALTDSTEGRIFTRMTGLKRTDYIEPLKLHQFLRQCRIWHRPQ